MTNIKEIISNRILYIGNEIPESIAKDTQSKFVLLGYPNEFIDELKKGEVSFKTTIFIPLLWVSAILIVLDFILRIVLFFLTPTQ